MISSSMFSSLALDYLCYSVLFGLLLMAFEEHVDKYPIELWDKKDWMWFSSLSIMWPIGIIAVVWWIIERKR